MDASNWISLGALVVWGKADPWWDDALTPGVLVAALALVATLGSFWWINVRRGHLESYEPQVYSGYILGSGFRLRLPLTIFNTAPGRSPSSTCVPCSSTRASPSRSSRSATR